MPTNTESSKKKKITSKITKSQSMIKENLFAVFEIVENSNIESMEY